MFIPLVRVVGFGQLLHNSISMMLHDAIEKLLKQKGRPMTTLEIARELNKNKWYVKGDGSCITSYQIHGRTKNKPQLFNRSGTTVSLNSQPVQKAPKPRVKSEPPNNKIIDATATDISLLGDVLMNEKKFKPAKSIDDIISSKPGLYCIRIKNATVLPNPFNGILKERGHNIVYIGIASQSLRNRFLNQELRANGHGTFFRSIGAVLGYRPAKGSLANKANKRNYKFLSSDENKIISWINSNLIVNWVEYNDDFTAFETGLIQKYLPLLNIANNPAALQILSDLRAECVRIANLSALGK